MTRCEKMLLELVKDARTPQDAVRILLDKDVISTTALRDLEVYYSYRENLLTSGRIMHAIYDTEIVESVSKNRIYRARARFED